MASIPYGIGTLRKISLAGVGCTNVTDDRQMTDGQAVTYSKPERKFTFAN